MTLPNARPVDVDGQVFHYLVKKAPLGSLRLTVELEPGKYLQAQFAPKSVDFAMEHARDLRRGFTPADAYAVIKAAPRGVLPEDFELANWNYLGDGKKQHPPTH